MANNSICNSACTLMLPALDLKKVSASAVLGFHGPISHFPTIGIRESNIEELIELYKHLGISQTWLQKQRSQGVFSHMRMSYFKPHWLENTGFIDEILDDIPSFSCRNSSH